VAAALPVKLAESFESVFEIPVLEIYGMTETTALIAGNPLPPGRRKPGSVGLPAGPEVAIMHEDGTLLPPNKPGEVVVRGESIMRGYENLEGGNAETFRNSWFRTGDFGYLDEDNYLFLTGRIKDIINRGGEKISPSEVDNVLAGHPAVMQAAAFGIAHKSLGEDIAAAVVLKKGLTLTRDELIAYVSERVAYFKVPRTVFFVDELPRTPNGKIRRNALAEILRSADPLLQKSRPASALPATPVAVALAEIWSAALGLSTIGVDDNFFDFGGDSLRAATVINRIQEQWGETIYVAALFDAPTIALFERFLNQHHPRIAAGILGRQALSSESAAGPVRASIEPADRGQGLELSYGQQRLYALAQLRHNSSAYNIPAAYRLTGPLQTEALARGLSEIQRRHEILRTTFSSDARQPRQVITPPFDVTLPVTDLSDLPEDRRLPEAMDRLKNEVQQPFSLAAGPTWRVRLLRLAEEDHILAFTFHHMVFDGWSKNVLQGELSLFYSAIVSGKTPDIAPLPVQYVDFAHWHLSWLRSEAAEKQGAYWKSQMDGSVSELMIPAARSRPAAPTFQGDSRSFVVPAELLKSLHELSRREGGSLFIILLAGFDLLLHRYTEQEDVVVCSPVACRNRSELEPMIGYFNNIVALRTDLSGNPTFREVIGRVRKVALGAYENQDLPIQRLAELPSLARIPLTRAMFSYGNAPGRALELPGITASPVDVRNQAADFDMAMSMELRDGQLGGILEFNADLFDTAAVSQQLQDFVATLGALASNPDQHVSDVAHFGLRSGDVESLLAGHPQVTEAAVVMHKDQPGLQKLVAYVVPNQFDIPKLEDLRNFLRQRLPDYLVPFAFVSLDGLPLTRDGKVDRAALPPPVPGRAPGQEYAAPRTPLERQLAKIWTKVLWMDQEIGIRDNFFDLGGHSLLSVQLVVEMENLLKRKLSARALFRLGTIEELVRLLDEEQPSGADGPGGTGSLAAASEALASGLSPEIHHGLLTHTAGWEGKRVKPTSLIVGLQTDGRRQNLFWCCQGFRELSQLAKYMGPDQPVYGMRSAHRVVEFKDITQPIVDALAAQYVSEILEVQPEGPFLIGGNCQAAQIAFHIAEQLMAKGHYITLLCLQELFIPQYYPGRVALLYGDDSARNPFHYFNQPETVWRKFYTGKLSVGVIDGRHGEFFREPNIQKLTGRIMEEIDLAQKEPRICVSGPAHARGPRLGDSAFRAEVKAPDAIFVRPGGRVVVPVSVKNLSDVTWPAGAGTGVTLGYRWLRNCIVTPLSVDPGFPLPADLPPGSTALVDLRLAAPLTAGAYELEIDLVEGGNAWFKDKGSVAPVIWVRVHRLHGVFKALRRLRRLKDRFSRKAS
jgi:acyl carrier protein